MVIQIIVYNLLFECYINGCRWDSTPLSFEQYYVRLSKPVEESVMLTFDLLKLN